MPWTETSSRALRGASRGARRARRRGRARAAREHARVARADLPAGPRGGRGRDARERVARSRSPRRSCRSRGSPAGRRRGATSPAGARRARCTCSPRGALERRASAVPDSHDMLMLTPAALYAQLVIAANNRRLPPPLRPRQIRWAWLWWGAAAHFSGQTVFARPAIARRLREDPPPRFPPEPARRAAARRHGLRPARARARAGGRRRPRLHAPRGLAGARARARLRGTRADPQPGRLARAPRAARRAVAAYDRRVGCGLGRRVGEPSRRSRRRSSPSGADRRRWRARRRATASRQVGERDRGSARAAIDGVSTVHVRARASRTASRSGSTSGWSPARAGAARCRRTAPLPARRDRQDALLRGLGGLLEEVRRDSSAAALFAGKWLKAPATGEFASVVVVHQHPEPLHAAALAEGNPRQGRPHDRARAAGRPGHRPHATAARSTSRRPARPIRSRSSARRASTTSS